MPEMRQTRRSHRPARPTSLRTPQPEGTASADLAPGSDGGVRPDSDSEEQDRAEDDANATGDAGSGRREEADDEREGEEGDGDGDGHGHGDGENVEGGEDVPMEVDNHFDSTGLKEIGNLASWTVSTFKPGNGVEALRDDDTNKFWQSDGPQPHRLNIHFSRLVSILCMRIYLDFDADESYTPTRIAFLAGTGYHDLIQFATLEFTQPKGWISVSLDGVGGGKEGNVLRCHLLQVQIVENHQNGKDTHVRGLKIYARDERAPGRVARWEEGNAEDGGGERRRARASRSPVKGAERATVLAEPDWMGEPELR